MTLFFIERTLDFCLADLSVDFPVAIHSVTIGCPDCWTPLVKSEVAVWSFTLAYVATDFPAQLPGCIPCLFTAWEIDEAGLSYLHKFKCPIEFLLKPVCEAMRWSFWPTVCRPIKWTV